MRLLPNYGQGSNQHGNSPARSPGKKGDLSMVESVNVGQNYKFNPCHFDSVISPVEGLMPGDIVRVVDRSGCPNTGMAGNCYVSKDGSFMGMVRLASLEPL